MGADPTAVRGVFASISDRYDLANRLMTGGLDTLWRRTLARRVADFGPKRVADLATGTGDIAFLLARRLGPQVEISGYDFCPPMLEEARRHAAKSGRYGHVRFLDGDALDLPVPTGSVDAVTIAWGVRNLHDYHRGFAEMHRILRPGGKAFILEFTQPPRWLHKPFYFYMSRVLPRMAGAITGDRNAYEYLNASVSTFPPKEVLAHHLELAGFSEVTWKVLTGGVIALHEASVPLNA